MKSLLHLGVLICSFSPLHPQAPSILQATRDHVETLLAELTLEEKVALCSGRDAWSTRAIERLGIPWIWMADGPHGLRRAPTTDAPGYGDQLLATCFPTASALAATWDTDLVHTVGMALGEECQALDVNVLLGPGVNIKRSVLGGRNFEYFSEDPILSGELGAAYINGVQSQGVGTSLKHFAANNVETMRMYANSDLDPRTLHEIYLRPFEIAVKKAQPWTVMACYNRVQGVYGTESSFLLTELLKDQWGFGGIVISDWFAVVDRVAGVEAGMHLEMPGLNGVNGAQIIAAVREGRLEESVLDTLVREILVIVLHAKSLKREGVELPAKAHHDLARRVASEAATLLKNDGAVLPITPEKYRRIALIGEFATAPRYQGNGSSEVRPTQLDNALELIRQEYGAEVEISYAQGYRLSDDNDFSLVAEAREEAAAADLAIVLAGLPLQYESEGIDRTHIDMPAAHNRLISEVAEAQENTVVVLTNGSAVAMPWAGEVPAILEAWLGGQAGAGGVADVLFGRVNPSGKLAETFPARLEDTPASFNFPGEQGTVLYGERIYVGYRYYDEKNIEPLFPFGHGLSYTEFAYEDLQVSASQFTDTEILTVTATIRNTGPVAGQEVIQLYVSDPVCRLQRPPRELKKFAKIALDPGESKTVSFELNRRDFAYFDGHRDQWIAESGEFVIAMAASSRDIRQTATVRMQSTLPVPVAFDEFTFIRHYWENPQTRPLLAALVPNWIRGFTTASQEGGQVAFPAFFIDHPLAKLPYLSHGELTADQVTELVEQCRKFTFLP